jgi:hypothetical protein
VLAVSQDDPRDRDLVHGSDGLANDRVGVVPDLAIGNDVIGPHQIKLVDFGSWDEFVDIDRPGAFERDVFELVLVDSDVGVGVDLVALYDVVRSHLVACLSVDFGVLDAMTGILIDLIETDLFGLRRRRKQRHRARDQRQLQEALPVCPRRHLVELPTIDGDSICQPVWSSLFAPESALRTGISHGLEHLLNRPDGLIRRQACKRLGPGDPQRLRPGMRVGPVLGPAMVVAFVDCTGLLQHQDRPPVHRFEIRTSLSRQHLFIPVAGIESAAPDIRSRRSAR